MYSVCSSLQVVGRGRILSFTDGRSHGERPGQAPAKSWLLKAVVGRGPGPREYGLHGGPRCGGLPPGPGLVPDSTITRVLPRHVHRQRRLQQRSSEAPRALLPLRAGRTVGCRTSASSQLAAATNPDGADSWGGRPNLAAASFGLCAGRLNGRRRSGCCCEPCA